MARLSLSFLGAPQLQVDGNPVKLKSGKSASLLAFLAIEQRAVRRDALVLLLWPDSEPSQGRHNLNQTLYSIKKKIPGDWLTSDGVTISLRNSDDLWIDVRRFRELLSQCLTHEHADTDVCTECRKPLEEAASLYNGDFLSDCVLMDSGNFDDWSDMKAETLRREYESVLQRLVRHHSGLGEHTLAIGYARSWLALDRLNETAHRWLMQLHAWLGDRKAALRQYQECAEALNAEVNAKPLEETTRLFEEIKTGNVPFTCNSSPQISSFQVEPHKMGREEKRLSEHRHNLPAQSTQLVGREAEVAQLVELLRAPAVRLVTLTGPGGVGKTRLALQVAEELIAEFDEGVFFITLDSVIDADSVTGAVANAFGLQERSEQSIIETMRSCMKEKHMLLVLDNFEHLLEAATLISDLIASCPALKFLVTSREVLRLQGEHVYIVPPLSLPDYAPGSDLNGIRPDELLRHGAVLLFKERATAVHPEFTFSGDNASAAAEICRRLDGLPLAIELAAARIRTFSPARLLERLSARLPLLTRGARNSPSRHQSLREAISWSYELLSEQERTLFRMLSVFVGSFTLEMVEEVCERNGDAACDVLDTVTSLDEKSLIKRSDDRNGEPRHSMLQTVREYAREKMKEAGEEESVFRRFCSAYIDMVEEAETYLHGPDEKIWLDKIEMEYANILAALQRHREYDAYEMGLRLAKSMGEFWFRRGYYSGGRYWLTTFLKLTEGQRLPYEQGWAYFYLGWNEFSLVASESDQREMLLHVERSLALLRESGDRKGQALALSQVACCTQWLGCRDSRGNPVENLAELFDESVDIARESGDTWTIALCSRNKAFYAWQRDKSLIQEEELQRAERLARNTGDPLLISMILGSLPRIYAVSNQFSAALELLNEELEMGLRTNNKEIITDDLWQLAFVYLEIGNSTEAWNYAVRCFRLAAEIEASYRLRDALMIMINVAIAESRMQMASRLTGIRSTIREPEQTVPKQWVDYWNDQKRIELDEETFAKEWTTGREMTEKEILQYISENPFK